MKVKFIVPYRGVFSDEQFCEVGSILEVSDENAKILIADQHAVKVGKTKQDNDNENTDKV